MLRNAESEDLGGWSRPVHAISVKSVNSRLQHQNH